MTARPARGRRAARPALGRLLLFGLVAFALSTLPVHAQLTTGTIQGTVRDGTGGSLPGAEIAIRNIDTGITRTLFTNEAGRYEAPSLPVGNYEVSALLQGFNTKLNRGIELTVGRTAVIDFTLDVGAVQQEVVVTADAPLVETTSATVSNLISEETVENLPLVNRDLTQLTFMQPGVVKIPSSGNQGIFGGMGDKFTVAGARGTQNLYLLDGVSNSDLSGNPQGSSGSYSGSETVKEIQIVTNNYSAEYRSAAGGIVSAVTKSGTNTLHGSAFEFFRNDGLDTENYFDEKFNNPKPDFDRNQYGGSIGGPIIQNKLFFFASYEGLTEDLGRTSTATVPSLNARQGRLVAGNVAINPVVVPYLNLYPVPGQGNQIVLDGGDTMLIAGTSVQPTRNNYVLGKVDYQVNAGNTLSGTYNWDKGHRSPMGILGDLSGVGTTSRKGVLSTKWTSVLSSASVNELHFGFSDSEPEGDIPLSTRDLRDEGITLFHPDRERMGEIVVSGASSIGYRVDSSRYNQKAYTLKEAYSRAGQNHSLRFGGEWTYYNYLVASCSRGCNGVYDFSSMANFLRGVPRRFDVMLPGGDLPERDMSQHVLAGYFQDNWRRGDHLTINMGLRYEYASTVTEAENRFSNLLNFTDPAVTVGVIYENPTAKSFSPRIGFVYSPGEGRQSFRGGFGIFYEHPMLYNIRTSLQELPPFTLVGRIDTAAANAAYGRGVDFPNAFQTQLAAAAGMPNIRTFQYELDQTYMYRWSLTYQRQFGTNYVVTGDYTGSRGLHLWQQTLPNLRKWVGWPDAPPEGEEKFWAPGAPFINPNFGEMRLQYSNGNSYYQGGSLSLNRRLNSGLQFGTAFTLSKAIDDGSGVTSGGDELPQSQRGIYAWDMYLKRGLSSYDIRKVFSANIAYELPFAASATGLAGALAKGWQVNSVITLTDGYPLSVVDVSDAQVTRIGDDEDLRPDLIPGGNGGAVTGDPEGWYDISQFTPSRIGYLGNLGRNTITSPGLATVDLSVFKNFEMAAAGRLQLRLETFNLFNRTNFGTPDMTAFINGIPNPESGVITTTRTPARQMQLGLRWLF